jgi:hypothetical protein
VLRVPLDHRLDVVGADEAALSDLDEAQLAVVDVLAQPARTDVA